MTNDKDRILFGTMPSLVTDPPNRPLTPEEKADPLTFFGVTAEMRAERAKAAGHEKPPLSDEQKAFQKESVQQLRRLMTADVTRDRRRADYVADQRAQIADERRRENIGSERERQLMGVHQTGDKVSRADYWTARAKAAERPAMSYFVKEQERDR